MATPKKIILEVLEDLEEKDFKKFKWFLQQSDILGQQYRPISRSRLENADKMDTVDLMVQTYSDNIIAVTRKILVEMSQNDLVKKLPDNISEPPGSRSETPQRKPEDGVPAEEKLLSVRTEFVKRASEAVLNQLLDKLFSHQIINDEEMQSIKSFAVTAERARRVIDTVQKKGNEASSALISALCEVDPFLSGELKLNKKV